MSDPHDIPSPTPGPRPPPIPPRPSELGQPPQVGQPAPIPPTPAPAPAAPPSIPLAEPEPAATPAPAPSPSPAATGPNRVLLAIRDQVRRVFIGQDEVLDQLLMALVAGGHVLLEGKPGLGKTHLVIAITQTFGGAFRRIQFTPDLMPSDVTGHTLFDMGKQEFRLRKGPVFTNLLLADEINRAPAKTQAALLEVMQERQVTIDGESLPLDPPFMTFATQNPIEQEGTYPLPEAQLDRFLFKVLIDYPEADDEAAIVQAVTVGTGSGDLEPHQISPVCQPADIIAAQQAAAAVRAVPEVVDYAVALARATRESPHISLGAGTRGAISLVRAAKAAALLNGRDFITPDDIKQAALPTLRHRIALAPEIAISGMDIDTMLLQVIDTVEAPRSANAPPPVAPVPGVPTIPGE